MGQRIYKRKQDINSRMTEVKAMQILLGGMAFSFGGFYEFTGFLAGICCIGLLFWIWKRRGKIRLSLNIESLGIIIVALGYGITILYGIDKGMAFLGFLKFSVLLFFLILVFQFSEIEKTEILMAVPISGGIILGIGLAAKITGIGEELLYSANRLGGTFQYSNTMALFFLTGSLILGNRERKCWISRILILFLYAGILMTGSRTVFVLGMLMLVVLAFRQKGERIFYLLILAGAVCAGGIYGVLTGNLENIGRFLTISLGESTLQGRFLYWIDGISILKEHIWGLGYRGYCEIQGMYQTGVYKVQFIHNEYLQILLDIGVFPGALFFIALGHSVFKGKTGSLQKEILILLLVHSFVDFNFQFLSIWLVLILCLDINGKREKIISWRTGARIPLAILNGGACLVWGYFFAVGITSYMGRDMLALKLFPWYTEAGERALAYSNSMEDVEKLVSGILKSTRYSAVAYSGKALLALQNQDYASVIESQSRAIDLDPYTIEEYTMYFEMLIKGLEYYNGISDETGSRQIIEEFLSIPERLEKTEERTSAFGWRIQDKPELKLPEEMQTYLKNLELNE